MIRRPRPYDYKMILYYTGQVVIGVGLLMLIPLLTALIMGEWKPCVDFLFSIGIALTIGFALVLFFDDEKKELNWTHGMVAASLSWLVCLFVAAIPYYLSGHYLSFLDAIFDVMSGFTTTGITLIQDLDHISNSLNMWRHVLTWVGGQGMVVLALSFLVKGLPGAYKMYVGEGKEERLLPSVVHTARAIWIISVIYLFIGTVALWGAGVSIGIEPLRAFLHGLWVYMAAWSTGGFAPQSQNILYYHSGLFEVVTVIFFVIGSFNFALHYYVLTGKRRELYKNIEIVSFTITLTVLMAIATYGLASMGIYSGAVNLFRKVFYHLISAHTTTGFGTIYSRQFILEWGDLALIAITIAMLIGGSACSTAGGFKGVRIGVIFNGILQDIRRLLVPESATVVQRYHMFNSVSLEDKQVRGAALIIFLYIVTFAIATLATAAAGYPLASSMFEAASVTGNVGLSSGVSSAMMPDVLKVLYILVMWVGRLEFMSVFALFGFVYAGVKGK